LLWQQEVALVAFVRQGLQNHVRIVNHYVHRWMDVLAQLVPLDLVQMQCLMHLEPVVRVLQADPRVRLSFRVRQDRPWCL
jgi:hypothetical protein